MKEQRYNELVEALGNMNDSKKAFIKSMIKDFVFLEEQIEDLRKYPRYVINKLDPKKQIKLPVHDMLKDYQAQKNDITTKILRTLETEEGETSPLLKALMRYENE